LAMDPQEVEGLLLGHYGMRPLMRVTDFYKLIFQGVFGVGHIMGAAARRWLDEESEGLDLDEGLEEPLLEDLVADGSMVRVNLRPFLRRGLDLAGLYEAMVESEVEGSNEEFRGVWSILKGLVNRGDIAVDREDLEDLDRELREEGCRPHHHSQAYREAYKPAYRVVSRRALESFFDSQELG
jgi:hypothetical protein